MFMKNENTNFTFTSAFFTAIKSVIVSMLFTALALVLLAALVTYGPVSEEAIGTCTKAATLISIFFAALMGASKIKKSGWLVGAVTSVTYILIMFCISGIAFENTFLGTAGFKNILFCILSGLTGGILGVNIRRKSKK